MKNDTTQKGKKSSKWMPKVGERYYFVFVEGGASYMSAERGNNYDDFNPAHMRFGNFYKTRDEAKAAAKQINNLFRKNK